MATLKRGRSWRSSCALLVCALTFFLSSGRVRARWPDTEDELMARYAGVEDWFSFSQRPNIREECEAQPARPLRWVYFTRHPESTWDFIAISHHLDVPYSVIQSRLFYDLVRNTTEATDPYMSTANIAFMKWRGLGPMLCHIADIVVVGDVTADARPLLHGNCTTPLIIQLSNRFTIGVRDVNPYLRLMTDAVSRPWVWFVASNPFEPYFFESMDVPLPPERTVLLRPLGASFLPKPPPATAGQAAKIAVLELNVRNLDASLIRQWIARTKMEAWVEFVQYNHPDPAVLAQYRAVLHLPHQPASLAMYEAMAAGATFVLPSSKFFQSLLSSHEETEFVFCCRGAVSRHPDTWSQLFDWWHEDYRDGHVFFDSWDALVEVLEGKGKYTQELFDSKKAKAKELMSASRGKTLQGYEKLYEKVRAQSCDYIKRPDLWPPKYTAEWAWNFTGNEMGRNG